MCHRIVLSAAEPTYLTVSPELLHVLLVLCHHTYAMHPLVRLK